MNNVKTNVEASLGLGVGNQHITAPSASVVVIVAGHAECFSAHSDAVLHGTRVTLLYKETKARELLAYAQALSGSGPGVLQALVPFLPRVAQMVVCEDSASDTEKDTVASFVSLSLWGGGLSSDIADASVQQQLEHLESLSREQDCAEMKKFVRSYGGKPVLDGGGVRLHEMMHNALETNSDPVPTSTERRLRSVLVFENVVGAMTHPCVVDVKVGKRRYHPFTPREKREKIEKREGSPTSTAFTLGLRVCGSQRWVWDDQPGCRRQLVSLNSGKDVGHAMRSVGDMKKFLRDFFSPSSPSRRNENGDPRDTSAAAVSSALCRYVTARVQDLASRLEGHRKEIETSTALVSCSVLIVYDASLWLHADSGHLAARDVADSCSVFVIDLARCGPRDHNYSEDVVDVIGSVSTLADIIESLV